MIKKMIKAPLLAGMAACCALSASGQFVQFGDKVTGTGLVSYDHYGNSVALSASGNLMAVGAPYAGLNALPYQGDGKVFLYEKTATGWNPLPQTIRESDNGSLGAYFGKHIALSDDGNVLVVSGHGSNNMKGAFWVYRKNTSGTFVEEQKLTVTTVAASSYFADALAISGDGNTIVVGSPRDNDEVGSVFVFRYQGASWVQDGNEIEAAGAIDESRFGGAVDIDYDGNTIVIGGDMDNHGKGAAWICHRSNSGWDLPVRLLPAALQYEDYVGRSVSIDSAGTAFVIVGANGFLPYKRIATTWQAQGNKVSAGGGAEVRTVAMSHDGTQLVTGVEYQGMQGGFAAFRLIAGQWQQQGNIYQGSNAVGNASQGEEGIAMNADATLVAFGGVRDDQSRGALWSFKAAAAALVDSVNVAVLNNAPATITTPSGTLQLQAQVYPATASQAVTWSVIPVSGTAAINTGGQLTAMSDGTVWVKAASVANPTKSDSLWVTISGQQLAVDSVVVRTLNGVPAAVTAASPALQLQAQVYPAAVNQAVTWSVVPVSGNASVSSTGFVTGLSNGRVWVKAVSVANAAKSDSIQVTVSGKATSLTALEAGAVALYPNPVERVLTLKMNNTDPVAYEVYDRSGRLILSAERKTGDIVQIDVQSLLPGAYYLKIRQGTAVLTETFIRL